MLLACFFSCTSENKEEEKQVTALILTPVPELFSIAGFTNPLSKDTTGMDVIRNLNSAAMNNSTGNSATVYIEQDSLDEGKKPLFNPDMDYDVILSKEDLIEASKKSYNEHRYSRYIDSLDFSKYFVFAVSHPPGVNAMDEIFLQPSAANQITINLSSVIYPRTQESIDYGTFWMTKIYKIERQQAKRLLVKFDESPDSVFLNLVPKVKP